MNPDVRTRILALFAVVLFVSLTWLYVREFPVFSNTIGARKLIAVSLVFAELVAGGFVWFRRQRFVPWERHMPEMLFLLLFCPLFAPLAGSLLNRSIGHTEHQPFEFIAEKPYFASNYGLLKGEKIQPTGYILTVREQGRQGLEFKYKKQAYFPLTKPGETILLPVKKGLFGFRVMLLE